MAFYVGGNQEFSCEICCLESFIDNSSEKEPLLKVFKSILHKLYFTLIKFVSEKII